jgi:heme A synthase
VSTLLLVHQWTGYLVAVVILLVAFIAFGRAKDAREFEPGLYRAAFALLTLQVVLGLILYGLDGYWDAPALIAYVHPALAILALGMGQMMLGRARKTRMAVDAHRLAGRGLLVAFVLVLGAIGVASWPMPD